jgi:CPA2 family monovalent cation:H+ antiporter-2
MFLAGVLLVIIGTAVATAQVGLSLALGAFLAGLLFSETEYRHQIEVDIEPFKGLLLGLFFVSVGMGIDLARIGANPFWLLASVIGLFAIKGVIFYGIARAFGRSHLVALESALLLGQAGEFGFVVIGLGFASGLLPSDVAQFMLIVTGLTMLAAPSVAGLARRVAASLERREADGALGADTVSEEMTGHIVVVGYGRTGQMLGEILDAQEITHVALDTDSHLVSRFAEAGACVYYGDARQPDILRRVGVERAGALVVTLDNAAATEQVVITARHNCPDLPIYARARDRAHAARLLAHGATNVIQETFEASLDLTKLVLIGAGVPDDAAHQLLESRRQNEQSNLDQQNGSAE